MPSMKTTLFSSLILAAALAGRAAQTPAPDDTMMRAMRDELARSVAQLQMENLPKPYFISYAVQQHHMQSAAAEFGSTVGRSDSTYRRLVVQVRVGTPQLDNTNFRSAMPSYLETFGSQLSLDDDYATLRRQIWLATDKAYKAAVEQLARKKAALENKTDTDDTPDFSAQPATTTSDVEPAVSIDLDAAVALVRELSAEFRQQPAVATSNVRAVAEDESMWYVNSDGTSFVREKPMVGIMVAAATQAPDGGSIADHYQVFRHRWTELPAKAEIVTAIRALAEELTRQQEATMIEPYNGPVLFEGQAAAEVFAQAFAVNLVGRKVPVAESTPMGMSMSSLSNPENPFLDKLGARVLPESMTVIDDPTLKEFAGVPLLWSTKVDDEGVPTAPVHLVEKGRLKTLLVSRAPVRGVPASTGSLHGSMPSPTNLIVKSAEGLDAQALRAELLKNVQQRGKTYGVIVRRVGNPDQRFQAAAVISMLRGGRRVEPAIVAVKVFLDGHEEPLRNVEIAGVESAAFKEILAAGNEPYVTTMPFRVGILSTGPNAISVAVPSLLFEDVTLKKPTGQIPKPPVSKHPFFDRT